VLTLFLREVKLSDVAGMVARGEAVTETKDEQTPTLTGSESVSVGAASAGALSPTASGPQADGPADSDAAIRR